MSNARSSLITPHDLSGSADLSEEPAPLPEMLEHALAQVEIYAREKPWHFGLSMMGIGFVLGWKLKFF